MGDGPPRQGHLSYEHLVGVRHLADVVRADLEHDRPAEVRSMARAGRVAVEA